MKLEKSHTRLKCKPCKKFYNSGTICEKCGGNLREITVWNLEPEGVKVKLVATEPK